MAEEIKEEKQGSEEPDVQQEEQPVQQENESENGGKTEKTDQPDIKDKGVEIAVPSEESEDNKLDILVDVSLNVTVELGRKEMIIGEILKLTKGSVIELNKLVDDPVDIYVNQSKIAEGEVVVVDEHFGVRITKLVDTNERINKLE